MPFDENKVPEWLKEAHKHSSAQWADQVLALDSLQPMRIDEHERGYQRPLSGPRVDDLVSKFDAGEARPIFVSEREDGSRWILDGQHTWAALKEIGLSQWPCRVFYHLTPADEAHRFAEYQNNTRKIPPVVQFNAEVLGRDETAVNLERILGDYYLRIASTKLRTKDGFLGVTARAVFQRIYQLGGEALLREVLQLAIDAWGQNKSTFHNRVLPGMAYLLAFTDAPLDRARMLSVLRNTTPKQINEDMGPTGGGGASRRAAMAIINAYVEGTTEFPRLRKNDKAYPTLPEKTPKGGPIEHEYWTPETHDYGRVSLVPVPTEIIEAPGDSDSAVGGTDVTEASGAFQADADGNTPVVPEEEWDWDDATEPAGS